MTDVTIEISFDRVRAINVDQTMVDGMLVSGPAKLCGWSLLETSGAAPASAAFGSGQTRVGSAGMAAGLSSTANLPTEGIYCPQGISLAAISGVFQGCIYAAVQVA